MKDVRFFLEYESKAEKNKGTRKSPGNHSGNVLALLCTSHGRSFRYYTHWRQYTNQEPELVYDAVGATYFERNSPVSSTSVSHAYLTEKCKRISEALAREIHPALFEYFDYEPEQANE
jgi:hypothetical protein